MKITINYRFILGIDIAKQTLELHLLDRKTGHGYARQISNAPDGFGALGHWLASHGAGKSETVLCSEHCGRYGEHLLRWTTANGWPHAVLKTTALQKVGDEHHRKSDPWDAQGLAEYGQRFADRLRLAEAPKPNVKQLRRLRAERRRMVDQRASLKQKRTESGCHDPLLLSVLVDDVGQVVAQPAAAHARLPERTERPPEQVVLVLLRGILQAEQLLL